MKTLRIGIRSYEESKAWALAIARGEIKREPDEPRVWVTSLASLAQLIDDNRVLMELIARHRPASVTELAGLAGRAPSNLSRTLATMESYGLVEMVEGAGKAKAPRLTFDQLEIIVPASTGGPSAVAAE